MTNKGNSWVNLYDETEMMISILLYIIKIIFEKNNFSLIDHFYV